MSKVSGKEAWKAYERKDYSAATAIWEQLIGSSQNEMERDSFEHGYGYALVGLKRFKEAREIWRRLYDRTGSHIYIHQLGMVEREAGNYAEAAELFEEEHSILPDDDNLAKAANLYEQSLVESLFGNHDSAVKLAERCLVLSMTTKDKVMHGCAYRLLGDLSRHECPSKARSYYLESLRAFEEAEDRIACGEIDDRLKSCTTCVAGGLRRAPKRGLRREEGGLKIFNLPPALHP
jgi:tetratricopeptide (TPR) repeat protein